MMRLGIFKSHTGQRQIRRRREVIVLSKRLVVKNCLDTGNLDNIELTLTSLINANWNSIQTPNDDLPTQLRILNDLVAATKHKLQILYMHALDIQQH